MDLKPGCRLKILLCSILFLSSLVFSIKKARRILEGLLVNYQELVSTKYGEGGGDGQTGGAEEEGKNSPYV